MSDRTELIYELDALLDYLYNMSSLEREYFNAESIIMKHNGSEDDSGPEGMFSTMTESDLRAAIDEIKQESYYEDRTDKLKHAIFGSIVDIIYNNQKDFYYTDQNQLDTCLDFVSDNLLDYLREHDLVKE